MELFEPVKIRGMELKNRFVMPAMHLNLGFLGKRAIAFYEERAKGGLGCINTAAITPDPFLFDEVWEGKGTPAGFVAKLRETLVPAAHKHGAKIGMQLWTGNMFPAGMWGGYNLGADDIVGDWVAPSARDKFRALTTQEVKEIIERLAQGAVKMKEAGFDFVDFNLAHGYLPNQFFSPVYNQRTDEYGGNLKRRMRFGTDLVKLARHYLGEDFPIQIRLGAEEYRQKGITIKDSVQFAAELVNAGADVISTSVADAFPYICPLGDSSAGTYVPLAEAIKDKVDTLVVGVGRINTLEAAERALASGKIDLVGIGRQSIADPHWVKKVSEGRSKDIIPCLSCNTCVDLVTVGHSAARCAVNPFTGKEYELPLKPAEKRKKVFVIGGGPAGMEAATVAAARGHEVTLFEKKSALGGQLKIAGVPPYKQEINWLNDYLVRQVEQSNATIRLNETVTAKLIEKEKPDAVVMAAGLTSFVPDIPGMDRDNVVLAEDVLSGRKEVGRKVVIIGGELVACETADLLGTKVGRSLIVARRGPKMAVKVGPTARERLLERLKKKGVRLLPGVQKYEKITDKGLVLIDSKGKKRTIEADTIIIAAGSIGNAWLSEELKGKVPEIYSVGDCKEPRDILEALTEGAKAGTEL